jgi:hypothetical protein
MKSRIYAALIIIICALIGVVCYFFIPPFGLFLGFNVVLLYVLVTIVLISGLLKFIWDMWRDAPEAWVFKDARENEMPVLEDIDVGSHNARFILWQRDEDYHIKFETDYGSVKLDPSLTTGGAHPTRHPYGLTMHRYASLFWLPITERNALAYKKILEMRHDGIFKELDFLADTELMQLLNTPRKNLENDVGLFLNKYEPEWQHIDNEGIKYIETSLKGYGDNPVGELIQKAQAGFGLIEKSDLVDMISLFQDKISRMQTQTGFFSYEDAFQNISFAHAPQDFEHAEMLMKKREAQEWLDKINLMTYASIGIIAVAIIVVGITALHYVFQR